MKKIIIILCVVIIGSAFISDSTLFKVPLNWPTPTYNFSRNTLTKEKIRLGRVLFYDPILSGNNTISCSSCHSPFSAFTHVDHALSHGINDKIGTRNSIALMNLAWQKSFMWDGAINHLDMQALAPISSDTEMGSSIDSVVVKLKKSLRYKKLFYNAFGDSLASGERTLKSLSQFMLTLVSANSKYDFVQRNEAVFTDQENNGYKLFKSNCASCHSEPLFTNGEFAINGLQTDTVLKDLGRMKVTGIARDSLLFKVPTLRNIAYTYPYMHDGRFKNLQQVLNHYINNFDKGASSSILASKKIVLNSDEKVDLIAFLMTLSDRSFIFDVENKFPKKDFELN